MSTHHPQNTKDFIQLKDVRLQQDESISSYDVKALFTSVPIQPVLNSMKNKLENDKDLKQRTSMTVGHITSLLEYCLKSTYFVFQGKYYEQLEGAAMGSPLSPIIANIYMEEFETKAKPPTLWKKFVDDTYYPIHCRRHPSRWILTLLGCSSHSSSWWNFVNICILKTNSYQSIFTMG